jgi:hypothetical protein
MGHAEDIKDLQTKVEDLKDSSKIENKIKDSQPIFYIIGALCVVLFAWSDLKYMAQQNKEDVKAFEDDITGARDYTQTKFNELKSILDDYKKKQDSTHDQVLLLKGESHYTKNQVAENNQLLKELIKQNKTGK